MGRGIWIGLFALGSLGCAQSLLEHSAAAAGGSVGGVAGKKVSDGLTSIFEKVDQHTQKAAKGAGGSKTPAASSSEPLLEVGPGVPKQRASVPPPPPPLHRAVAHKPAPLPLTARAPIPVPSPELELPPQMTASELRGVTAGMRRSDVLKLGQPAARISMYDDGHLVEIYRYLDHDADLGVVRLTDGSVSSVQVR